MNIQELTDGLAALGFTTGYAAKDAEGDKPAEIILWENEAKQPTAAAIAKAAAQGAHAREIEEIKKLRQIAYMAEADPIFFQAQRESSFKMDDWHTKIAEIEARYPYPTKP
jgi:molybdopterin-guanine dinucleotide biosynthesis protein A